MASAAAFSPAASVFRNTRAVSKRSRYRSRPLSQSDCRKGDHLYVHRLHSKAVRSVLRWRGYTHHGIYTENGEVIDFAGFSSGYSKGPIRRVKFEKFAGGFPVYRWSYASYRGKIYSPDEIVIRAQSQIGVRDYSIVVKNCENFANWCVTGRSISRQVPTLMQKVGRHFHSWRFNG